MFGFFRFQNQANFEELCNTTKISVPNKALENISLLKAQYVDMHLLQDVIHDKHCTVLACMFMTKQKHLQMYVKHTQ